MSAPRLTFPYSGGGGGGITGSGTAGYVAKFTSGTAVGNSLVRDDGTNVSIDSSPSVGYKLTVNGDTTIIGRIDALTGSINTLTSRASQNLTLQRDGVTAATVIAGGLIGVGCTDPANTLETYASGASGIRASSDTLANITVSQTANTSPATLTLRRARGTRAGQLAVGSGDAIGTLQFTAYGTSDNVLSNIRGNVVAYTSATDISSNLTFGTSPSGSAAAVTRLTIDEAGVSTFTGPVRATGTAATAPAFTGSDTDTGMYFPAANQVRLATNGTLAVAVDASQNVGVQNANPAYPLHVGGGNNTGIVTTGPAAYVATNGATSLVVRDATNGIESFLYAGSSVVLAGAASAHSYHIRTNNTSRLIVSANTGIVTVGATAGTTSNTLDVSTASWGVKLPTAPGNGDANTLDCYLEGTWTPAVTGLTAGSTTSSAGNYTRIGNRVLFSGIVRGTGMAGNFSTTISMPIAPNASNESTAAIYCGAATGTGIIEAAQTMNIFTFTGSSTIIFSGHYWV